MCRQKRTSACHSLHRNAEADPTLDEGPLGQKLLKLLPWMEPLCASSRLTPDVVEETLRQGLSVPPVLITLPLAALHNKPGDTAAVVELLPPQPLRTSAIERTDEREAHVESQGPRFLYLARQTAIAFRHFQKTRHPGLARPISWPRRRARQWQGVVSLDMSPSPLGRVCDGLLLED